MPIPSALQLTAMPVAVGPLALYPWDPALAQRFTVKSKFEDQPPMQLWSRVELPGSGEYIGLPWHCCPAPPSALDARTRGRPVSLSFNMSLRPGQVQPVARLEELLLAGRSFVMKAPTGSGKCHGRGTRVLMHGGGMRAVEHVEVGDLLLGPDGRPREVLSLARGVEQMYRVTPKGGKAFTCNESHVLSLKMTGGSKFGGHGHGDVVNLSVREYLAKSNTFRHCAKSWRAPAQYPVRAPSGIPPYILGLLLGDGSLGNRRVGLTVHDEDDAIITEWRLFARRNALHLRADRKPGANCQTYWATHGERGLSNPITDALRMLGLAETTSGDKFIPHAYLYSELDARWQLFAGLMDSDGSLQNGIFDYVSKSARLADNVSTLAWGLGLRVTRSEKMIKGVAYQRLCISGDLEKTPSRLERKKPQPRQQKKDPTQNGFLLEALGEDEYFGFTLSGDHLYLLEDCTVTHNTIMSLKAIARLGISTLVAVPKDDLMDQWVERIEQAYGLKPSQIGRVQGDRCDFMGKEIVLGSLRSLCKPNRYPKALYREFGLLVGDEVHRWGAEQMAQISSLFYARQRLGLTATFHRSDGRDLLVEAHVGAIEVEAKIEILKPKVFRFKSTWKCPVNRLGQQIPHQPGRVATILHSLFSNGHRNRMICHFARTSYNKGRRVVIFSDHLEHLDTLHMMLPAWGVPAAEIGHYYGSTTKQQLQTAGTKQLILATYPKMAEGTDIPELDTLILAGPRSNIEQTVGRILRDCATKQPPVVFDIVDNDSPVLAGYAKTRLNVYAKLGASVIDAHVPEEELHHAR